MLPSISTISSSSFSSTDINQNLMSEAFRGETAEGVWSVYAGDLTIDGTSNISKASLSIIGH